MSVESSKSREVHIPKMRMWSLCQIMKSFLGTTMGLSNCGAVDSFKRSLEKSYNQNSSFSIYYIQTREKAMAPHSSTLAQKIPWMEEPGRLQSMGSLGVGHNWVTSLSLSTFMHWRRKWQPTPVFLPGESHGRRSLVGCSPWGRTESDTTEAT